MFTASGVTAGKLPAIVHEFTFLNKNELQYSFILPEISSESVITSRMPADSVYKDGFVKINLIIIFYF
jgi:hypothetical protein